MSAVSQMALMAKASSSLTLVTLGTPSSTNAFGAAFTEFDRSVAAVNGVTVQAIGIYSTTSGTFKIKIGLRNSAGNYTTVYDQSVSHGSAGWQDFNLTVPYGIAGTAYFIGVCNNTVATINVASSARAILSTDQTGTAGGYTEDAGANGMMPLRYYY